MKFTGERYIPKALNDRELEIEHIQRYYSVKELVKGKVVLDAACGEGYGSKVLSESAKQVYGLDISEEAINHARNSYKGENVQYVTGSIAELPFGNGSIDIIVSFETIEHVGEVLQHKFLAEVLRVLKPDGILVISTPDKKVYSDVYSFSNEFHVKEFYTEEFKEFLGEYFSQIDFYFQSFQVASIIGNQGTTQLISLDAFNDLSQGKYNIAICSNVGATFTRIDSLAMDVENKHEFFVQRVLDLQKEVEDKNAGLAFLNEELNIVKSRLEARSKEVEHFQVVNEQLGQQIKHLTEETDGLLDINKSLRLENKNVLNENNSLTVMCTEKDNEIMQLKQLGGEQQEHLLEAERTLNNIYSSHGWKVLLRYYKLRDRLLPTGTKRMIFAKLFMKFMDNPILFMKHINWQNVKKLFHYLRTDNGSMIETRFETYLDRNKEQKEEILDLYINSAEFEVIEFPLIEQPLVSIVIPVFNQWHYTYSCLKSIFMNSADTKYEIVVADDVSSDLTKDIKGFIKNIKIIRNDVNQGFLLNCNKAAKHCQGKYIVFLNNDTNVQPGWLSSMLELLEADEKIGLVGAKLVYADGRLQEAGGIIWRDASGWNYGRLDDPSKPQYNYVKEVDYISGAAIMIRRQLWEVIGGFDERYVPAYFEDSDLAFEVRRHGYQVVFQPRAKVVHFEGISHGTDECAGVKRYQVKNREKFIAKWRSVLEGEHFPNGKDVFWARDRSGNKKTILVIDHYVPHFDKDAGSKTTFQYLSLFVEMGLNVKFIGDNFYRHEPYTTDLEKLGIEVLCGSWFKTNLKRWITENGDKINYVLLNRPHISIKYVDLIRECTKAKVIYYGHDLHYLREMREYELTRNPELLKSSERWRKTEFEIFKKVDVVYYPSMVEVDIIKNEMPKLDVKAIPPYIFEKQSEVLFNPESRKDMMFVGGFGHKPNYDAVLWFVDEIFPKIVAKLHNIKLYIVGSNPPAEIQSLKSRNIEVTGFVSDQELERMYKQVRIVIAPLRYGAGIKGKVVEAMYHGVPVVTTSIGAEGLLNIEEILPICDTAGDYVDKLIHIYEDSIALEEISAKSVEYVKRNYSREAALRIISTDIEQ